MSLIVGVALAAAAIIALISGDVLGLIAANGWTELAWGIAAVILLFNTIVPRRRRTVAVADRDAVAARDGRYRGDRPTEVQGADGAGVHEERAVHDGSAVREDAPTRSNAAAVEGRDPEAVKDPETEARAGGRVPAHEDDAA
jgi:hypothetical protein